MAVNVLGTIDLCRQLLPHLTSITPAPGDEGKRGVLILVASIAAFEGQPGQVAYSASKGAIVSLTLPLMRDLTPYGIQSTLAICTPSICTHPHAARVLDGWTHFYAFYHIKGGVLLGLPTLSHVTSTPTLRRVSSTYNCLARVSCLPLVVASHLSRSQDSILFHVLSLRQ